MTIKEPWQMTYREYIDSPASDTIANLKFGEHTIHYGLIEKALKAGKPVPLEVLNCYPDFQRKV